MSESKHKHAGGRPTKYCPEYCEEIIRYFERRAASFKKNPSEVHIPLVLSEFATKIKVSRDSIKEWAKVYPEFSASVTAAKGIIEQYLVQTALMKKCHHSFTQFILSRNHGWEDRPNVVINNHSDSKNTHDLSKLTDDELKIYEALVEKTKPA